MSIQWYPGHMVKTKRVITESLKQADIVIELLDARIPQSGKNPDIDAITAHKNRIIVLNKTDLADKNVNLLWRDHFAKQGHRVVMADSLKGVGFAEVIKAARELTSEKRGRQAMRGRVNAPIRAIVAGIPNVGKSTFINKFAGYAIAKTADRPGITRAKQWIKIDDGFLLMDTPGILWPKFDGEITGVKLAATGAIKDEILDIYTLTLRLIELIVTIKPQALTQRYKIEITGNDDGHTIIAKIAGKRGFIKKGGELDLERAAIIITDEFRAAKLGRISLERP